MMIIPDTGWFEIFKVPRFDLDKVAGINDEYIYKSSDRVNQLFKNTWLIRYPFPRKVVLFNSPPNSEGLRYHTF